MPRVSKKLINSTVYFFDTREHAKGGEEGFLGGGFISGRLYKGVDIFFVLTAGHVISTDKLPVMRINTNDGNFEIYEVTSSNLHMSDDYDLAIIDVDLPDERHDVAAVSTQAYVFPEDEKGPSMWGLAPGVDTFMVGRFAVIDEALVNTPALRFGNISTMPVSIKMHRFPIRQDCYCVDMHSRPGYSGSAVFAYRTLMDNDFGFDVSDPKPEKASFFGLLGVHLGQLREDWDVGDDIEETIVVKENGRKISGMSGMAIVLPARSLLKELKKPEIQEFHDKYVRDHVAKYGKPSPVALEEESKN